MMCKLEWHYFQTDKLWSWCQYHYLCGIQLYYHWLPQVSFRMTNVLLQQTCCHDKHMFVMTKHIFCCNISMFTVTKHLLQQNYVCCDKIFLSQQKTSVPLLRQKRHVLLWHTCVCHDQEFVATKLCFFATNICHNKSFVMTKICLSWQKFCHDKQSFVATEDMFCQDKQAFVPQQTCVCHNKTFVMTSFVATKVILVAAPASDTIFPGWALRSTNSKLKTTHSTLYMLIYSTDFVSLNLELFCVGDG